MSNYRGPVDYSEYSGGVVCCPRCSWRSIQPTQHHAWYALARHYKNFHGDNHAASMALNSARRWLHS